MIDVFAELKKNITQLRTTKQTEKKYVFEFNNTTVNYSVKGLNRFKTTETAFSEVMRLYSQKTAKQISELTNKGHIKEAKGLLKLYTLTAKNKGYNIEFLTENIENKQLELEPTLTQEQKDFNNKVDSIIDWELSEKKEQKDYISISLIKDNIVKTIII